MFLVMAAMAADLQKSPDDGGSHYSHSHDKTDGDDQTIRDHRRTSGCKARIKDMGSA